MKERAVILYILNIKIRIDSVLWFNTLKKKIYYKNSFIFYLYSPIKKKKTVNICF